MLANFASQLGCLSIKIDFRRSRRIFEDQGRFSKIKRNTRRCKEMLANFASPPATHVRTTLRFSTVAGGLREGGREERMREVAVVVQEGSGGGRHV